MTRRHRLYVPAEIEFPRDFPQRLQRFKDQSDLSWRELARRLGTEPKTLRRWRQGVRPGSRYLYALMLMAREETGTGGIFL